MTTAQLLDGTAPAAATAEAPELLAAVGVDLAPVELLALLLVAQNVEGGGDALEPVLGRRVAGVLVRMEFLGQLPERLADLVLTGAPRHAQFLVGITRHVRPCSIKAKAVS